MRSDTCPGLELHSFIPPGGFLEPKFPPPKQISSKVYLLLSMSKYCASGANKTGHNNSLYVTNRPTVTVIVKDLALTMYIH